MVALVEDIRTTYLSPMQAAQRLGISEATLRYWAAKGKMLGVLHTPHGKLYSVEEVERLARERAERRQS